MKEIVKAWIERNRKSVYFFALHRGGSSILGSMLGKSGLRHFDYAADDYAGRTPEWVFPERGCVFGPLRLSLDNSTQEGALVHHVIQPDFLRDKNCIVMVRDPRDILVSAYHSFGASHGLSDNPTTREEQERLRSQMQAMSIDEFVLWQAPTWRETFDRVEQVIDNANEPSVISFEEMVEDFASFARKLTRYLPLTRRTLGRLQDVTRPREAEAFDAHKRSGQPGAYREKLRRSTIEQLNAMLEQPLTRLGYEKS